MSRQAQIGVTYSSKTGVHSTGGHPNAVSCSNPCPTWGGGGGGGYNSQFLPIVWNFEILGGGGDIQVLTI